jgi:hypothetical protein
MVFYTLTHHRKMLHFQIPFPPKVTPRLSNLDSNDIFYTYPKLAIRIVSRLIRYHVAWLKRSFVVKSFQTDSLWTFVDIQKVTDAVTCTMTVIQSVSP